MGEIIKLKSRYSTINSVLKQMLPLNSDNDRTYKFVTDSKFIRCGYLDDGSFWIDPDGGPFLQKGSVVEGRVISNITHSYDVGYLITFE